MREHSGTMSGPRQGHGEPRLQGRDGTADVRQAGDRTLAWSLTAMSDALRRLVAADSRDVARAVAAATEAVWWVTTTDAAMTRHHPSAYSRAFAGLDPAARRDVEGILTGLRFIRSQLGYSADPGDFISLHPAPGFGTTTEWTRSAVPPQRRKSRDIGPLHQYRTHLAGRSVADTLGRAAGFLAQAHAATAATASSSDRLIPGI